MVNTRSGLRAFGLGLCLALPIFGASSQSSLAETINSALAKAYENNATLNAARAGVRVSNESVPLAKSGFRPTISGDVSAGVASNAGVELSTGTFGVQINQNLFDGFQTKNDVASARATVAAAGENLRNTTQNTLFDASAAFMDVIRDRSIAALRAQNISFLQEQVRASRVRLEVGEGTNTDVAQAVASLATAEAQLIAARANIASSEAVYQQIIGASPGKLEMPKPISRGLPNSLSQAYSMAAASHPAIKANQMLVDSRSFDVKSAEGQLLPQLSAAARVEQTYRDIHGGTNTSNTNASLTAQLRVPIYQGGRVSAQVRQGKERLGQQRIEVNASEDQVRAAVASAWAQLESAKAQLGSSNQQIRASQLALDGLIEEQRVGQRTTLDVLNGQNGVISSKIAAADAQRNAVVASYALLSATGRLTPETIGLGVKTHDPEEHLRAVEDKWFGLRTPDGR